MEGSSAPPAADTPRPTIAPSTADFDYYVLALSWAPDYYSANRGDAQECSPGKKYASVLDGLWPQYTKRYPSNCSSESLPESVRAQFPRPYANDKFIEHEWNKHGNCSGLSPAVYMALAGQIRDQIQIPACPVSPCAPATPAGLNVLNLVRRPGQGT